jgi:hypothetical protein
MSTVFTSLYTTVKTRLETLGADFTVTHYTLTIGDADATTGVPATTYSEGASIEMIILSKAASQILQGTGLYVKLDCLGLTQTAISEGDRIKDADNHYYTAATVQPNMVGDQLAYYSVDLTFQPLLET